MLIRRKLFVVGIGIVLTAPLLAHANVSPAEAAPAPSARAIVSMNVAPFEWEDHPDPRPQTWDADPGTPTLAGVEAMWDNGRYSIGVGTGSDTRQIHPGLSGQPGLGLHNPDAELGVGAFIDHSTYEGFDGRADFLDLAADQSGHLTRFDLVYSLTEQRAVGAVFGEIRMNEPELLSTLSPTAQHLVWPRVPPEDDPVLASDAFRNTSGAPLHLGEASIAGADRDFTFQDDTCSGSTLPTDGSCSVTVAYRPTKGGPRLASLILPTPTDQLKIDLASAAPLGRSSITTTGRENIDKGHRTRFSPIVVYDDGDYGDRKAPDHTYRFYYDPLSPQLKDSSDEFALDLTKNRGGIEPGTHKTRGIERAYGLDYHANRNYCGELSGTIDVRHFAVDADGQPTLADVDFEQRCVYTNVYPAGTIHGKLRYQDRKDIKAPRKPTKLRLANGRLSWKRSTSKDFASTVVRVDLGTRFQPARGAAVYQGSGESADVPRLSSGMTYTVAAFSIDKTGNASEPSTIRVVM